MSDDLKDIPPNVRFWVWWNHGWVKITLVPYQTVSVWDGGQTEEGFRHFSSRWTHHGKYVERETYSYERDCNGPHENTSESECRLCNLAQDEGHDGTRIPAWSYKDSFQRDHYAEAAGY